MKKSLLFAAALCAATSGFAQIEVGFVNQAALDEAYKIGDKSVVAEGTLLSETKSAKMLWTNETQMNKQNSDFNGIKSVVVNGEEIALVPGIGGETNPSAVNVFDGPTKGGVQYHFEVNADGWLIIPSKISSNKNFYAYEGSFEGEMNLMAYTLGMALYSADYPELEYGVYTLPADELGYCDLDKAENYLLGGTAVAWPIRIFTQNAEAASAGNGTGCIMFPVFADAKDYYVFATGSKMNTCGYIFVPGEAQPSVSFTGTSDNGDRAFAVTGEYNPGAGVEAVAVENADAPIYNALGIRVNADAKGLLIQNGKKFIRK